MQVLSKRKNGPFRGSVTAWQRYMLASWAVHYRVPNRSLPRKETASEGLTGVVSYNYVNDPGIQFPDVNPGIESSYTQVSRPLDVFPVRIQFVVVAEFTEQCV